MPQTTAQEVVREILRQAGQDGLGTAKLSKAFYFAHVYYAKKRPEMLTDWPIAHLPNGPGIANHESLLGTMRNEGVLASEDAPVGPFTEHRYRLASKADASLGGDALSAISEAVAFCKDKTDSQLRDITHDHSRAWNMTRDGEIMEATLDAIPDDEYKARRKNLQRIAGIFATRPEEVPA